MLRKTTSSSLPLHEAFLISSPDCDMESLVATVGGGGKTTLLFSLALEREKFQSTATPSGVSVLTTTTRFTIPSFGERIPIVLSTELQTVAEEILNVSQQGNLTVIIGSEHGKRKRINGIEIDWPKKILMLETVNFVGVEADGSAGRPFKAPATHEPVIPIDATHVLAVVGVQVLGRPIDNRNVHRPDEIRNIVGCKDHVDAEVVASVLVHQNGARKYVDSNTRFIPVVTHAMQNLQGVLEIVDACHQVGIERIVAYDASSNFIQVFQ